MPLLLRIVSHHPHEAVSAMFPLVQFLSKEWITQVLFHLKVFARFILSFDIVIYFSVMNCLSIDLGFGLRFIHRNKFVIGDLWHAKIVFCDEASLQRVRQGLLTHVVQEACCSCFFLALLDLRFDLKTERGLETHGLLGYELDVFGLGRAVFGIELGLLILSEDGGVDVAFFVQHLLRERRSYSFLDMVFFLAFSGFILFCARLKVLGEVLISSISK
jgi:hypothetical protein